MNIRFRLRSKKRRESSATVRGRVTIDGAGWVIRESAGERATANPDAGENATANPDVVKGVWRIIARTRRHSVSVWGDLRES